MCAETKSGILVFCYVQSVSFLKKTKKLFCFMFYGCVSYPGSCSDADSGTGGPKPKWRSKTAGAIGVSPGLLYKE